MTDMAFGFGFLGVFLGFPLAAWLCSSKHGALACDLIYLAGFIILLFGILYGQANVWQSCLTFLIPMGLAIGLLENAKSE
jgi:hypothetical protein